MREDMRGLSVIVTAGGTEEPIDPIRIITNRSSGKMGFALADAALTRGARVTLISSRGDGGLPDATYIPISTVDTLRQAVLDSVGTADVLVMAAAVSDFRSVKPAEHKIKKTGGRLTLELEPVPDFTREVPDHVFSVGFAAETQDLINNGLRKFKSHKFDLVCANDVSDPDSGFGTDTNRVTLIEPDGNHETLPLLLKTEVAHRVLDRTLRLLATPTRA